MYFNNKSHYSIKEKPLYNDIVNHTSSKQLKHNIYYFLFSVFYSSYEIKAFLSIKHYKAIFYLPRSSTSILVCAL